MTRRRRGPAALALVWAGLALACATTVETTRFPALEEIPAAGRIAVAPFQAEPRVGGDPEQRLAAARLVARFVAEELAARGFVVVPPEDVGLALGLETPPTTPLDPSVAARVAHLELGATALLVGRLDRYRQRGGEALGTTKPASVAFEVSLYAAPGGEPLWRARFDETQQPMFENLLKTLQYPGRGSRWLTAEDLARWGAREVASAVPLAAATASAP